MKRANLRVKREFNVSTFFLKEMLVIVALLYFISTSCAIDAPPTQILKDSPQIIEDLLSLCKRGPHPCKIPKVSAQTILENAAHLPENVQNAIYGYKTLSHPTPIRLYDMMATNRALASMALTSDNPAVLTMVKGVLERAIRKGNRDLVLYMLKDPKLVNWHGVEGNFVLSIRDLDYQLSNLVYAGRTDFATTKLFVSYILRRLETADTAAVGNYVGSLIGTCLTFAVRSSDIELFSNILAKDTWRQGLAPNKITNLLVDTASLRDQSFWNQLTAQKDLIDSVPLNHMRDAFVLQSGFLKYHFVRKILQSPQLASKISDAVINEALRQVTRAGPDNKIVVLFLKPPYAARVTNHQLYETIEAAISKRGSNPVTKLFLNDELLMQRLAPRSYTLLRKAVVSGNTEFLRDFFSKADSVNLINGDAAWALFMDTKLYSGEIADLIRQQPIIREKVAAFATSANWQLLDHVLRNDFSTFPLMIQKHPQPIYNHIPQVIINALSPTRRISNQIRFKTSTELLTDFQYTKSILSKYTLSFAQVDTITRVLFVNPEAPMNVMIGNPVFKMALKYLNHPRLDKETGVSILNNIREWGNTHGQQDTLRALQQRIDAMP